MNILWHWFFFLANLGVMGWRLGTKSGRKGLSRQDGEEY